MISYGFLLNFIQPFRFTFYVFSVVAMPPETAQDGSHDL